MQTTTSGKVKYSEYQEGSSADSPTKQWRVENQLRQYLELQGQRVRVSAEGTQFISFYTAGSYTPKQKPFNHSPPKWAGVS